MFEDLSLPNFHISISNCNSLKTLKLTRKYRNYTILQTVVKFNHSRDSQI